MYCKMQNVAQLGGVFLLLWLHYSKVSCQGEPTQSLNYHLKCCCSSRGSVVRIYSCVHLLLAALFLALKITAPACQVDYDYSNGPNGPANWGNLNYPDWILCKTGTNQSPININTDSILHSSLDVNYTSKLVAAEIYNNGHTPTIKVLDHDSGILTILNVKYELVDFHFHIPSEHHILNQSFSMELHLVHESADGKAAVIALLYTLGPTSPFLAQFFDNLPSCTTPIEKMGINITLPQLEHFFYFRYNGSLTTPPCYEDVIWAIMDTFYTFSTYQLQQLQASMQEENARPIQPKNGRIVYLFTK